MKTFIKYVKTIHDQFSFGQPKENKNGHLYFCVFGLDVVNKSLLPTKLQKLITLGNSVTGYGVNYTPPHKSKTGEGIIYFGPKEIIEAKAFDIFLK